MDKRFRVLHIMGTLWKVLAWIALIAGVLSSFGVLLVGILGSGGFVLRYLGQDPSVMPGALSVVSGILGFVAGLIATIIYFLILYAIGELIFLLLAIEENTRLTAGWTEYRAGSATRVQ
ncbi:MAG: hypothetical protein PVI07_10900 [Anaerolineae bacterium]